MNSAFVLQYILDEGKDSEELFFIGVYSTEPEARTAIERLKDKPGFQDSLEGFRICPYEINRDHWTEGFILPWIEN
jgi:hypothetical protein